MTCMQHLTDHLWLEGHRPDMEFAAHCAVKAWALLDFALVPLLSG